MHKDFYASGFIFHPASEQILLQQSDSPTDIQLPWGLFESKCLDEKSAVTKFQQIIQKLLGIEVKEVYPIYSYENQADNSYHYMMYAKVNKLVDFPPKNGLKFAWFDFKKIPKLHLDRQVEHNIIIGQRVIDSAGRKSRGEQTLE